MKFYFFFTISSFFMIGCIGVRQTSNADIYKCNSLQITNEITEASSGLIHGYSLEAKWLKNSLSTEEANNFLWDFWMESWNENNREILKEDTAFQKLALDHWKNLQNKKQPSDHFWYYTTPDEYWDALAGQEGVVLLRNCVVIGTIVTWQS